MTYNVRRIFSEEEEKKARRFASRVKGTVKRTQSIDGDGNIKMVYIVEWKGE